MYRGIMTGFLGSDLRTKTATIYDTGDDRISYTNIGPLGLAILSVFAKQAETANKYLYISTATVSQNEILTALEKATGEKWTINKVSTKEAGKIGAEKMAKGDFSGIVSLLHRHMYGGDTGRDFREKLSNGLLGLPSESLGETERDTVAGKRP